MFWVNHIGVLFCVFSRTSKELSLGVFDESNSLINLATLNLSFWVIVEHF